MSQVVKDRLTAIIIGRNDPLSAAEPNSGSAPILPHQLDGLVQQHRPLLTDRGEASQMARKSLQFANRGAKKSSVS